ncbi:TolC family protein [Mucilaginibacter sp.]|uniref:TolC family protein n=1 Tax=Mucilaginibacter sp. TaxID=1882438 RepID=UPI0028448960|nr:TolC family protein [Mucilaginibacter sp.]MDR3697822.1 TolC family protein [Mucilaginibacter sp.]
MQNKFFSPAKARILLLNTGLVCSTFLAAAQNSKTESVTAPEIAPDTGKVSLLMPVTVKNTGTGNSGEYLTLQQCIEYARQHQPAVNISQININIAKTTNLINLSTGLPQVSASGDLIHYIQQSQANTSTTGTTSSSGHSYSFVPGIAVTQSVFNPSLLYAYKSAPLYVKQAQQESDSTKIFLVSAVSKSFYALLLTLEQINVLKEDTAQFGKSYRDAYHQYKGGIVDETDYEQAEITLNNTKAQLKQANENVIPQYATLKQLIGYPTDKQFNVVFDTLEMMKSIHVDTTEQLQFEKRIEFQLLGTNKSLLDQQVNYYRYSFLPTVSAFYNYNLAYQNNHLSDLFSTSYPSSLVGISLSVPIFTGFYRLNNLHKAKLQEQVLDWQQTDLKSQINVQYTTALANYKGNYYNLLVLQKNVELSRRVYFVVSLQYRQGVVPYLNVITAETNLINSEINYLNALFQVLSNKIDLEKAMGNISY